MTVSVGVASYPHDAATFAEVMFAANIATHQAKFGWSESSRSSTFAGTA